MSTPTQVVFLGPTLDVDRARQILPEALFLPPVAQGDVLDVIRRHRPHSIGIVDGVFIQRLAVFHKEIIHALSEGIWVVGSSSMGALRAAECNAFGMIGVGEVYELYRSGEICDDDEVAVSHSDPADGAVRLLSEPFVNTRATIEAAVAAGAVAAPDAQALLAAHKQRYFPDRDLLTLMADARQLGWSPDAIDALRAFWRHSYVDLKERDAFALLASMASLPDGPMPEQQRPTLNVSHVYQAMIDRDAIVEHDGDRITRDAFVAFVAAEHRGFNELRDRAMEREALVALAIHNGVSPTDEEVDLEVGRYRTKHGLLDDAAFDEHRARIQFSDTEWVTLFRKLAVARKLRRWIGTRMNMRQRVMPVLEEMVARGEYEDWLSDATLTHYLADQTGVGAAPDDLVELAREQLEQGWDPQGGLSVWLEESGVGPWTTFADTLKKVSAGRARRAELERLVDQV